MRQTKKLMLQPSRLNKNEVEAMVEVDIDMEALFLRMGNSAWRNKSKRARALNGLIDARVYETTSSKQKREAGQG